MRIDWFPPEGLRRLYRAYGTRANTLLHGTCRRCCQTGRRCEEDINEEQGSDGSGAINVTQAGYNGSSIHACLNASASSSVIGAA